MRTNFDAHVFYDEGLLTPEHHWEGMTPVIDLLDDSLPDGGHGFLIRFPHGGVLKQYFPTYSGEEIIPSHVEYSGAYQCLDDLINGRIPGLTIDFFNGFNENEVIVWSSLTVYPVTLAEYRKLRRHLLALRQEARKYFFASWDKAFQVEKDSNN